MAEEIPEPRPMVPGSQQPTPPPVSPEDVGVPVSPEPAPETPAFPQMPDTTTPPPVGAPEGAQAPEQLPEEPQDDPVIADSPPLQIPDSVKPQGSGWASAEDAVRRTPPSVRLDNEQEYSQGARETIRMIQDGLDDENCTQIDGYGPARFSAQMKGQNMLLEGASFSSADEYLKWLRSLVERSGSIVTWDQIEEERMGVLELRDGSRLSIFLPPVARFFPTFSLRKHTAAKWQTEELIKRGSMDERMLLFLKACIAAHVNILFVGAMGSGKSTLMRALLQGVGDNERLAIVEQVPELGIRKPLAMEYLYQPTVEGYGLGDVLDYNLYNGLDRLIVGEVHLDGITKMLETMILTEGSMSTYHAYSTEQAGERMKLALQLENSNVSAQTAVSFIRQAIEVVVVLEKLNTGRKVTQITEIDWRTSMGKESLAGGDLFIYDRKQDRFIAKNAPHLGRVEDKLRKYQVATRHDWFIEKEDLQRFKRRATD